MQRTKLADRSLPNYSRGEEIFNSVTHIIGAVFGIYVLLVCVLKALAGNEPLHLASALVYGISMTFLYTISGVYHGCKVEPFKKVMQVIDHCGVFLMVAGSYTPIMLCGLYKTRPVTAVIVLTIVYVLTAIGIVLECIDLYKFHAVTLSMEIIMGWMIIAVILQLYRAVGFKDVAFIVGGGLLYSIGAVLYHKGAKKKYFHSVFHIFVLVGTFLQFLGIIDMI